MLDREKVMTWLKICGKNNDCSGFCPYSENGFGEYGQCRESLIADAYDLLKEQEAVVRCKDCKHWCKALIQCSKFTVNGVAHCTSPEWFCADGEQKSAQD